MAIVPGDIQRIIDHDFPALADRQRVTAKLAALWASNLNVGADELAKAILYLATGNAALVDELIDSSFHGDPRDMLVEAMEKASEISTEADTEALRQHKLLRHLPVLLQRWKGKPMRLHGLTDSPRYLCIQLSDNRGLDVSPCLQIRCLEPTYMRGQFDYGSSDLEIKQLGKRYVVYDRKSGFEVGCEQILVSEHSE